MIMDRCDEYQSVPKWRKKEAIDTKHHLYLWYMVGALAIYTLWLQLKLAHLSLLMTRLLTAAGGCIWTEMHRNFFCAQIHHIKTHWTALHLAAGEWTHCKKVFQGIKVEFPSGKTPSVWWCLWIADFRQSLNAMDLPPRIKYDDVVFWHWTVKFVLICPIKKWLLFLHEPPNMDVNTIKLKWTISTLISYSWFSFKSMCWSNEPKQLTGSSVFGYQRGLSNSMKG